MAAGTPSLSARAEALLAEVAPPRSSEGHDAVLLGEGTDHVAHLVDGAYVVRQRLEVGPQVAADVEHERRLLALLGEVVPVPVPEVLAADPEAGITVVRLLPGTSLLDVDADALDADALDAGPLDPPTDGPFDATTLVPPLAALLAALGQVPRRDVADLVAEDAEPPSAYLEEVGQLTATVGPALQPYQQAALDGFLATPPPPAIPASQRRLCHDDLGAEHLLVDERTGALTGVIDWSDAAWTDPAHDLGRLLRDLGPEVASQVARHVAPPTVADQEQLWERSWFHARCTLVEDLAHGLAGGGERYARAALRGFDRTFAC